LHLVTVNDYLARRDAEWMGPLYDFLGVTVGVIQAGMDAEARRAAYACDVTFGTNSEFGFDYLRDNLAVELEQTVQRGYWFAIVDEVDSILIDEARTPLIISGQPEEAPETYFSFAKVARTLRVPDDYEVDEKRKTVAPTEAGVHKIERALGVENLYAPGNGQMVNHFVQSLKAESLYKRDIDYVVVDGQVKIVDEFTGRIMEGRRWSEGLHQAIEAKEGVSIEAENVTVATVTIQNYAGTDVVLAGPGEAGWISFEITDVSNAAQPRPVGVRGALDVPARVLAAGERYSTHLTLNRFYPVSQFGTYAIKTTIYYAGAGQFYDSNRIVFQVNDAHRFWEKSVGVPAGYPDAGAMRRFELLRYREQRKAILYARVTDERSRQVHATFPLGGMIEHESPQVTTDRENRMHVLFLTSPRVYVHAVINPDGSVAAMNLHEDNGSIRPTLTQTNNQQVAVRGGTNYVAPAAGDPSAPGGTTPDGFRSASERPTGF
jgi:hypothetical protein